MMYPILCKVKYETLHRVFQKREIWVQIGFSIVVNWIIAPLVMVISVLTKNLGVKLMTFSLGWHGRFSLTREVYERV